LWFFNNGRAGVKPAEAPYKKKIYIPMN
jgi:hypothetical protein